MGVVNGLLGPKARADDEESFRSFVVARRGVLLRTAWLLTGNRDDAEDLVQTALVRVARHWPRIRAGGSPEAYLRRVLVTAHISAWRRERPDRAALPELPELPDLDPSSHETASATEDRVVLAAALARLTPKQRAVLVLRFYEDLTEVQTAQLLGVGVGTVKSQTRHALARLRVLAPELAAFEEVHR